MRLNILVLLLLSGLLLSVAPPALAANKSRAVPKAVAADSEEIPTFNWALMSAGYIRVFKLRNEEIESTEPNRFFPASAAFALGRIDEAGHYLMLKCFSGADQCGGKRDQLEERVVYSTLLEVVRTPKAPKALLYNARTWELTPLGYKYIEKLLKRYPDLHTRLGRLMGSALAEKRK